MRMIAVVVLGLLVGAVGGCNSYHLRYEAKPQPSGGHLYADVTPLENAVGVMIDTDGRRLEECSLVKPDGTAVRPLNVAYPAFGKSASIGLGTGVGIGHVGVGTGLGIPVGPTTAKGLTTATFSTESAGPPPWTLKVKVQGLEAATVPGVGGAATAK